jgi:hypothetical protein
MTEYFNILMILLNDYNFLTCEKRIGPIAGRTLTQAAL